MRVEISADVFVDPNVLEDIIALMKCFVEGRHDWIADLTVVSMAETYFRSQSPHRAKTYADLARKGTVATLWAEGGGPVVRIDQESLPDLVHDLCRAGIVVVEDQDSDGSFVRVVARAFEQVHIVTALDQGWLELGHGGGSGSVMRVASAARGRFKRLCRVVALLDGDSKVPSGRTRSHQVQEALAARGINAHVLRWREIENYIPNRVLAGLSPQRVDRRVLTALKHMTPDQRGHFDMKRGFGALNRPPTVEAQQAELYASLSDRTRRDLRGGFGEGLSQRMEQMSASSGAKLTRQDFSSLGDHVERELLTMLRIIASVI